MCCHALVTREQAAERARVRQKCRRETRDLRKRALELERRRKRRHREEIKERLRRSKRQERACLAVSPRAVCPGVQRRVPRYKVRSEASTVADS